MRKVSVTVIMNPLELTLFRRALAKAADDGLVNRTVALNRICELDNLRWKAEESGGKETPSSGLREQNRRGQFVLGVNL